MTWPSTMSDLLDLALISVAVPQGVVSIGLALLFVAFVWWVFQIEMHPDWPFTSAVVVVFILAAVLIAALAFRPVVRYFR